MNRGGGTEQIEGGAARPGAPAAGAGTFYGDRPIVAADNLGFFFVPDSQDGPSAIDIVTFSTAVPPGPSPDRKRAVMRRPPLLPRTPGPNAPDAQHAPTTRRGDSRRDGTSSATCTSGSSAGLLGQLASLRHAGLSDTSTPPPTPSLALRGAGRSARAPRQIFYGLADRAGFARARRSQGAAGSRDGESPDKAGGSGGGDLMLKRATDDGGRQEASEGHGGTAMAEAAVPGPEKDATEDLWPRGAEQPVPPDTTRGSNVAASANARAAVAGHCGVEVAVEDAGVLREGAGVLARPSLPQQACVPSTDIRGPPSVVAAPRSEPLRPSGGPGGAVSTSGSWQRTGGTDISPALPVRPSPAPAMASASVSDTRGVQGAPNHETPRLGQGPVGGHSSGRVESKPREAAEAALLAQALSTGNKGKTVGVPVDVNAGPPAPATSSRAGSEFSPAQARKPAAGAPSGGRDGPLAQAVSAGTLAEADPVPGASGGGPQGVASIAIARGTLDCLLGEGAGVPSQQGSLRPPLGPAPLPLDLSHYLPGPLCERYHNGKPFALYPWQAAAIHTVGDTGANLVYCAPTSGGKSLVAEVLLLRRLLQVGRPALVVLPFVALCDEKADHLDRVLDAMDPPRRTKRLYGEYHSARPFDSDTGAVVCTIEKANSLVNALLEEGQLDRLGCVVIDELHMVGDEDRGFLLELMLTKLRYAGVVAAPGSQAVRGDHSQAGGAAGQAAGRGGTGGALGFDEAGALFARSPASSVQIVGMSATMPNVRAVARWLGAAFFEADYRPVNLQRYLRVGSVLKDPEGRICRELPPPEDWDRGHLGQLVRETVADSGSVLVFCASKNGCELTAAQLARRVDVPEVPRSTQSDSYVGRAEAVERLRHMQGAQRLVDAVARGVAWHHSGLTRDEREVVEAAYRSGAVLVLCATSTLAAGVNLPARRVVFRQPYIGRRGLANLYDPARYRQMCGRAGRAGLDSQGEAILLPDGVGEAELLALMAAPCQPILSCLGEDRKGMRQTMLEAIATGRVATCHDINTYIQCTLLAATNDDPERFRHVVRDATKRALDWLEGKGTDNDDRLVRKREPFIVWDGPGERFEATQLGRACLAAGMRPEDALEAHERLDLARKRGVVLDGDLHLAYLCVPVGSNLPNFPRESLLSLFRGLTGNKHAARVAAAVVPANGGADRFERLMADLQAGRRQDLRATGAGVERDVVTVAQRLFVALLLHDLTQEVPMEDVTKRFRVDPGTVRALQDNASRFAHMSASFCDRMGWADLHALLQLFTRRVFSGVKQELAALTEIPSVKGFRARILYRAGYRTPEAVADVKDANILAALFEKADPNGPKGGKQGSGSGGGRTYYWLAEKMIKGARKLLRERLKEQQEQLIAMQKGLQFMTPSSLGTGREMAEGVAPSITGTMARVSSDTPTKPERGAVAIGKPHDVPAPLPGVTVHLRADGVHLHPCSMDGESPRFVASLGTPGSGQGLQTGLTRTQVACQDIITPDLLRAGVKTSAKKRGRTAADREDVASVEPARKQLLRSLTEEASNGEISKGPNLTSEKLDPKAGAVNDEAKAGRDTARESRLEVASKRCLDAGISARDAEANGGGAGAGSPRKRQRSGVDGVVLPAHRRAEMSQATLGPTVSLPEARAGVNVATATKTAQGTNLVGTEEVDEAAVDSSLLRVFSYLPIDPAQLPVGLVLLSEPHEVSHVAYIHKTRVATYPVLAVVLDLVPPVAGASKTAPALPPLAKPYKGRSSSSSCPFRAAGILGVSLAWLNQSPSGTEKAGGSPSGLAAAVGNQDQPREEARGPSSYGLVKRTMYVPLADAANALALWDALVAVTRGKGGLTLATYGLKRQLVHLADLADEMRRRSGQGGEVASAWQGSGALGGPTSLFGEDVADLRLSMWAIDPDGPFSEEEGGQLRTKPFGAILLDGCGDHAPGRLLLPKCRKFSEAERMKIVGDATAGVFVTNAVHLGRQVTRQPPPGVLECCRTAAVVAFGAHWCLRLVDSRGLGPALHRETCLARVLASMEHHGMLLDLNMLRGWRQPLSSMIEAISRRATAIASLPSGPEHGLANRRDCARALFDTLGASPPPNSRRGADGYPSTNKEVLQEVALIACQEGNEVAAEFARLLALHRELVKMRDDVLWNLEACTSGAPQSYGAHARVRTYFHQTTACTGRLATDQPNLQCIPKPKIFRLPVTAMGTAQEPDQAELRVEVRSTFVAPPGHVLLAADYCQQECRVLAILSGDPVLRKFFETSSASAHGVGAQRLDPFHVMAGSFYGKAPADVTDEERTRAKQLTYGLIYGMGVSALSSHLGCTVSEAREFMERFEGLLPGVQRWKRKELEKARSRSKPYITTLGGRIRMFPGLQDSDADKRAAAERALINTLVQGGAADLIKHAMVQLSRRLERDPVLTGRAHLVLQIHDELLLEVQEDCLDAAASLVSACMTDFSDLSGLPMPLSVPLEVRLKVGPSWGQLTNYAPSSRPS